MSVAAKQIVGIASAEATDALHLTGYRQRKGERESMVGGQVHC
ncbi:hypothetical protein [Chamaesiphon sp. VAR_48_metabat_135_sub]|nr:hypothetical protein [Chamaesiphon sp. VAR_48_metabat_135_sub]